ncbi:DEAD/DEAH box helicase [Halioxenophilus aromaticivorans]|uniref:DEAD/DEAH box helicase n=1 Tax=Halioxenophilus aromaticivorans TaxID=1306992 RepID=A0AAV3TZ97_9ALTE
MSGPTPEFSALNLSATLLQALAAQELTHATEIQALAVPAVLNKRDIIASAATGSGKTLAFLLPIVQQLIAQPSPNTGCRALIMVPTRELAEQISNNLKALAKYTRTTFTLLTGGADFKFQASLLRKNPEIIIATPGRLSDHLRNNTTDLTDLEFWVLDEADRMLDMGFTEDIDRVAQALTDKHQTLMFSATLRHQQVARVAQHLLRDPERLELEHHNQVAAEVHHQFVLSDDVKFKQKALDKIIGSGEFKKVIVFTNTKSEANRLRGVLEYYGHQAGCLHGDMTQDQRREILLAFRRHKFTVLIATDVAARGLDIEKLDAVIHFDMARTPKDYVHRAGRTGRAGKPGTSIALIAPHEWNNKARAENVVGDGFEKRTLPGLTAKYKGPDKVKSSGRASGKKRDDKKSSDSKTTAKVKPKKRARDQANKGRPKRFGPAPKKESVSEGEARLGDGFSPFKKK